MEALAARGGRPARGGGGERTTESTHGDGLRCEIGRVVASAALSEAAGQKRESEASCIVGWRTWWGGRPGPPNPRRQWAVVGGSRIIIALLDHHEDSLPVAGHKYVSRLAKFESYPQRTDVSQ